MVELVQTVVIQMTGAYAQVSSEVFFLPEGVVTLVDVYADQTCPHGLIYGRLTYSQLGALPAAGGGGASMWSGYVSDASRPSVPNQRFTRAYQARFDLWTAGLGTLGTPGNPAHVSVDVHVELDPSKAPTGGGFVMIEEPFTGEPHEQVLAPANPAAGAALVVNFSANARQRAKGSFQLQTAVAAASRQVIVAEDKTGAGALVTFQVCRGFQVASTLVSYSFGQQQMEAEPIADGGNIPTNAFVSLGDYKPLLSPSYGAAGLQLRISALAIQAADQIQNASLTLSEWAGPNA